MQLASPKTDGLIPTQPGHLDRDKRFPQAIVRRPSVNISLGWQAALFLGYNAKVELPSLPPDLSFPRLGNNADDINFAFQAKRSALGPHIAARWSWDEAFQRRVHEERYAAKPFFAIQRRGQRIGTISIEILPTHMRLGEFYLLPMFQGQGLGGSILQNFIGLADVRKIPIRLEYLHWNPVGRLYRRFGFVEMARSEAHCFMERSPTS